MGKPISVADPAFPRRGRQSQKGRQPIICQIFCRKMHENEKKIGQRGCSLQRKLSVFV